MHSSRRVSCVSSATEFRQQGLDPEGGQTDFKPQNGMTLLISHKRGGALCFTYSCIFHVGLPVEYQAVADMFLLPSKPDFLEAPGTKGEALELKLTPHSLTTHSMWVLISY